MILVFEITDHDEKHNNNGKTKIRNLEITIEKILLL